MKDDLKNERQPQKWKMTSKMEDNLKNGRQPQKWKTTVLYFPFAFKFPANGENFKTTSKI